MNEWCAICGCELHRTPHTYALPTVKGRSHATKHHFVAERFFGRSANRRRTKVPAIFDVCPWDYEGKTDVFCYECHEELLHNPVLLPDDIKRFKELVRLRGLFEGVKTESRHKIGERIKLLQDVIKRGLDSLLKEEKNGAS